jgi:WD40 repeat protein
MLLTASVFVLLMGASVTPAGALLGQEGLALAFAPSGTRFVAGMADNTVKVFDARTRQTVKVYSGHRFPVRAVAWSPNGKWIASGAENAEIRVWDVASGHSFTLTGHQRAIQHLAFDARSTRLVSTSDDDTVRVWNLSTRKTELTIRGAGVNVYGARFTRDGSRLVIATLGKGLCLYHPKTGALLKAFGEHGNTGVNDGDVNPSGTKAVSAGRDGKVGVWDLKGGKRLTYLSGHTDWVVRVSVSPNGKFVASSSSDGTVRVWNVENYRLIGTLSNQNLTGSPLAWSADSTYLLTTASDGFIRIYRVTG